MAHPRAAACVWTVGRGLGETQAHHGDAEGEAARAAEGEQRGQRQPREAQDAAAARWRIGSRIPLGREGWGGQNVDKGEVEAGGLFMAPLLVLRWPDRFDTRAAATEFAVKQLAARPCAAYLHVAVNAVLSGARAISWEFRASNLGHIPEAAKHRPDRFERKL